MTGGIKNPNSIFKKSDFINRLKKLGYNPTLAGYKKCLKTEIRNHPMAELARILNISPQGVKGWMKEYGKIAIPNL